MKISAQVHDRLKYGVAIGDRDELWKQVEDLPAYVAMRIEAPWVTVADESSGLVDEMQIVCGMFEMICNHLESPSAISAFSPLNLLVAVRGSSASEDTFVQALSPQGDSHLMIIAPGLLIKLADRFFRLLTCAEVWPDLGDTTSCPTEWGNNLLQNQPKDPTRKEFSIILSMMSALIIFYHEMAHILRGHSAYYTTGLGAGSLVEFKPLASSSSLLEGMDIERRAIEYDADFHSGRFLAEIIRTQAVFTDIFQNIELQCDAVALVAGITFNVFEQMAEYVGYQQGYHLPGTRTECFLEGFAAGLDIKDRSLFANGLSLAFEFCAKHYQAPCSLEKIEQDIDDFEKLTWPKYIEISHLMRDHVPKSWYFAKA